MKSKSMEFSIIESILVHYHTGLVMFDRGSYMVNKKRIITVIDSDANLVIILSMV